jgi:hypothetical protein
LEFYPVMWGMLVAKKKGNMPSLNKIMPTKPIYAISKHGKNASINELLMKKYEIFRVDS